MSAKKNYSRYFIILSEDDRGFGVALDRQPTGYTKIETKNGKCKITVYVQNLVKEKGPFVCYLVDTTKNPLYTARLGEVPVDDTGRGEVWWEYKEDNIANTGVNVDKFNVSAIVVEGKETRFPLIGYVGKDKAEFKDRFVVPTRESVENVEKVEEDKEVEKEAVKFKEYEESIEKEVSKEKDVSKEDLRTNEEQNEVQEVENKEKEENEEVERDEEKEFEDEAPVELLRNSEMNYQKQGKYASYFHEILKSFEEVKELTSDMSGCRWWKVKLDMDMKIKDNKYYPYYCVIYHLKMAYPYINYLKYCKNTGYYYFGIKYDKEGEVKYLLYGIEGQKDAKYQPYSGMTGFIKWIKFLNKDGGMWIMTYNPYNGCIMIPKPKID